MPLQVLSWVGENCGHRIGISTDDHFFEGEIELPVTQPNEFLEAARIAMSETYEMKAKDIYVGKLYDILTTLTKLRERLDMIPTTTDSDSD